MPFIGQTIKMEEKEIRLSPEKWAKIAVAKTSIRVGATYGYEQWQTLICRLSWLAALKRVLRVTFYDVYRDTRGLALQKKDARDTGILMPYFPSHRLCCENSRTMLLYCS